MKGILSILLLISICSIQGSKVRKENGSCKELGGQCVTHNSNCQNILSEAKCTSRRKCCATKASVGRMGGEKLRSEKAQKKAKTQKRTKGRINKKESKNIDNGRKMRQRKNKKKGTVKRNCKRTPKKCKREGGTCTHYEDECPVLISEDLCRGYSCNCCKTDSVDCGKSKKRCTKVGGTCKNFCDADEDEIAKGCKGKACKCCVPPGPIIDCKIKPTCRKRGGSCVTDPDECDGELFSKGCKGEGCLCCVPLKPKTTKKPTTKKPTTTKKPKTTKKTTTKKPTTTTKKAIQPQPITTKKTPTTKPNPITTPDPPTAPQGPGTTTKEAAAATTPEPPITAATTTKAATTSSPLAKTIRCGIESTASSRIVGGVEVTPIRKYSWQVGLAFEGTTYFCGGSIITDKYILTASHCFYEFPPAVTACTKRGPTKYYVGIGDHNQTDITDDLPDFVEPILVSEVFLHESWNCEQFSNDIAVLELSKSLDLLKYADVLHPICLPKDASKTYEGETATVSGWGSTVGYEPGEKVEGKYPNIQREVQLTVLSDSDCDANVLAGADITQQLCAAVPEGGKDSCQGDSGGPLTVKENGQYAQIGIVSYGQGCGSKGNPGVYAKVTHYLDWIKGKVGSETIYYLP